ncbi:MAG: LamG-like jellyroll fold domain-containing protein [Janthinobacterium lividum]
MRRIKVLGCVSVVATTLVAAALTTPAAVALSSGVSFSADDLPTWQANGVVWSIGQAKGKVYAGGAFTQLRPPTGGTGTAVSRASFAVLDAETGNPDSCQLDVTLSGSSGTVRSVIASPDGSTVYIGGNFSNVGGTTVSRVAAIDTASCTVKPLRVSSISSTVYALALSSNTLYVGGAFNTVAGATRNQFAAVNATTGALLPFTANAGLTGRDAAVKPDGRAIAVSPDGTKVALGGKFDTVNGVDSHALAIVDATSGSNLRTYPSNFIHRDSTVQSLITAGTGLFAGDEGTGSGVFDGRLAIDWTSMDQTWRDTCLGATQAVLAYQGTLYSASHAHDCSSMGEFPDGQRNYFNAEPLSSPTLLGWHPQANDGIGEGIGPRALSVATGKTTGKDYLWAAGEFTKINGNAQQSLTRFGTTDTGLPPTINPVAQAMMDGTVQVRFRSVVDGDDSDLTYKVFRNGATTPLWTGTAKSLWWTRPQITVVDSTVTAGTTYTYRVTASDGTNTTALSGSVSAKATSKTSDYSTAVQADGPSFYWRFDETSGTWVQDRSGSTVTGVNGLAYNAPTLGADGAVTGSKAYAFDGTDDQIVTDQPVVGPGTYTLETWIKTDTTAGGKIIGFGDGRPRTDTNVSVNSSNYDRQIYMENDGHLDFGAYDGGTQVIRSNASYNDNKWHHVVATQGAKGMNLYVDGASVARNTVTGAQAYYGVWHVGGDNLNSWPNQPSSSYFKGSIDETAVYPTALTGQQVAAHYTAGGGTPNVNTRPTDAYGAAVYDADPDLYWRLDEASGSTAADATFDGVHPGTVGSAAQLGQAGKVGKAVTTSSTPDSLVVGPQTPAPTDFSLQLWFKSTTTSGGKLIGFENTTSGNGSSYDKHVYLNDSGQLLFGVYTGGPAVLKATDAYNDGQWHQVVATQDSSAGMKLYVDGQLKDSNNVTTHENGLGYWRVGGGNLDGWPDSPTSGLFSGSVDEVAVYGKVLSGSTIASQYALGQ